MAKAMINGVQILLLIRISTRRVTPKSIGNGLIALGHGAGPMGFIHGIGRRVCARTCRRVRRAPSHRRAAISKVPPSHIARIIYFTGIRIFKLDGFTLFCCH